MDGTFGYYSVQRGPAQPNVYSKFVGYHAECAVNYNFDIGTSVDERDEKFNI